MKIQIDRSDRNIELFASLLAQAGSGAARKAVSDVLNREGEKGRTQIRRALVRQSGLRYGLVAKSMKTRRSTPGTLAYTIIESGEETNVSAFGARERKAGIQAAPWSRTQVFKGAFMVPRWGNKVFRRTGRSRFPVRGISGPNLGREVARDEALSNFEAIPSHLKPAIERRLMHEFGL